MKVAIIGSGYVGLVAGACLAETGNDVICADVDARKIERLTNNDIPIYEPGLEEMIERNQAEGRLGFSTDVGAAVGGLLLYLALIGIVRQADAVMRDQQRRLVEGERLAIVGEMASAVAHSIRNPLSSIRTSVELALDHDPGRFQEPANDIVAEVDKIEAWIRELLAFTRPGSIKREAVDVNQVVRASLASSIMEPPWPMGAQHSKSPAGPEPGARNFGDLPLDSARPRRAGAPDRGAHGRPRRDSFTPGECLPAPSARRDLPPGGAGRGRAPGDRAGACV